MRTCSIDIPYLERELNLLIFSSQEKSKAPFIRVYLTPGKSFALPPLTNTWEYDCRLCPCPIIRAVTINLLDNLTLATFRLAELGFLGETILTLVTIPFLWGQFFKLFIEEDLIFLTRLLLRRPNWWIVGTYFLLDNSIKYSILVYK